MTIWPATSAAGNKDTFALSLTDLLHKMDGRWMPKTDVEKLLIDIHQIKNMFTLAAIKADVAQQVEQRTRNA